MGVQISSCWHVYEGVNSLYKKCIAMCKGIVNIDSFYIFLRKKKSWETTFFSVVGDEDEINV